MFCDARNCPISPAACQVVPLVSCLRSSSTMSRPAELRQVIGDRTARNAAADDDGPRLGGNGGAH